MSKRKNIPKFKTEAEEQKFWATHDSAEYLDWSRARKTLLPNLKPSTKTISLRLPEMLLADIKQMANKQDIPYQSLMKRMLSEYVGKNPKR